MPDIFTSAPAELGPNGELILTWFMEHFKLGADDRDAAIGSLMIFAKGKGQPPQELFLKFPDFAQIYYTAASQL